MIKSKYRDQARPGTVPTFREFVKYLVRIRRCQGLFEKIEVSQSLMLVGAKIIRDGRVG